KQAMPIRALAFSPQGNLLANGTSFGAVLLALAFAAGDDPEGWQEYRQSFKGLTEAPPGWELKGDEAEQCVRFEPEGVRITMPLGKPPTGRGTGVTTFMGVKGDFEITVSFEVFHEPEPRDVGTMQSRVSVEILLDRPRRNMAAVTRRRDRAGSAFTA